MVEHHLYDIELLDRDGNPVLPGDALPVVHIAGLEITGEMRVFAHGAHISCETAGWTKDGKIEFNLAESAIYDIADVTGEAEQPQQPEGQSEQPEEQQQPEKQAQQPGNDALDVDGALLLGDALTVDGVQPGDDAEQPGDDTEQPGDDTEQPGDDTEQPGDDAEQPGDDAEQPGDDAEQPGDDAEQPGDDAEQPGDDTEQPGDDAPPSAEDGDIADETDDTEDQKPSPLGKVDQPEAETDEVPGEQGSDNAQDNEEQPADGQPTDDQTDDEETSSGADAPPERFATPSADPEGKDFAEATEPADEQSTDPTDQSSAEEEEILLPDGEATADAAATGDTANDEATGAEATAVESDILLFDDEEAGESAEVTGAAAEANDFAALQAKIDAAADGGTIVLDRDYKAVDGDKRLEVTSGKAVTIDLNGHTVDADRKTDQVFYIGYENSAFTLKGDGAVRGAKRSGVYVVHSGVFTLTDGATITGNGDSGQGSGVYVYQGAFNMSGGGITGNTSKYEGGGVYLNDGTFNLSGGGITGNIITDPISQGGGVFVSNSTFNLSGDPVVRDNTAKGAANNVYTNSAIIINGALGSQCDVGITWTGAGGAVIIYGGAVTASGGKTGAASSASQGAGIGGGHGGAGGSVTVYGGTVTATGNTNTAIYDGKAHTVSGYTAKASNELYDVAKDFTFSGTAEATRTDAGRAEMGLKAEQFKNINGNFKKRDLRRGGRLAGDRSPGSERCDRQRARCAGVRQLRL